MNAPAQSAAPVWPRVLLPGAILLVAFGLWWRAPANFIAEDSYFYLVTARRMALDHMQSFSGIYGNDGVHPLHLYLLAAWSVLVSLFRQDWLWNASYGTPYAFLVVAAGLWNLARLEGRLGFRSGTLTLPPLVFVSVLGVLYSEAHVLFWALTFFLGVVAEGDWLVTRRRAVRTGVAAALLTLARLDMCFMAVAFLGWVFFTSGRLRARVGWMVGGFAALLGPYVITNELFFGGAVPVSGWLKSSFPWPHAPTGLVFLRSSPLASHLDGYNICFGLAPILLSTLLAPRVLGKRRTGASEAERRVGAILLAGAWMHLLYTTTFSSWSTWYWYYVLAVLCGTFFVAATLRDLRWAGAGALVVRLGAVAFAAFILRARGSGAVLGPVAADAGSADLVHSTVLISEAPGTFAFRSHGHVMAADMLTGDRRTYEAMRASGNGVQWLLDAASRAGTPVDYILWVGGDFLKWDPARSELIYYDPKVARSSEVIGRLHVGPPDYADPQKSIALWKMPRPAGR
jgi:hypothetical protein